MSKIKIKIILIKQYKGISLDWFQSLSSPSLSPQYHREDVVGCCPNQPENGSGVTDEINKTVVSIKFEAQISSFFWNSEILRASTMLGFKSKDILIYWQIYQKWGAFVGRGNINPKRKEISGDKPE